MFTTYRVTRLRPDGQARRKRPLNALFAIVRRRILRMLNRADAWHMGNRKAKAGNGRADAPGCA